MHAVAGPNKGLPLWEAHHEGLVVDPDHHNVVRADREAMLQRKEDLT